MQEVEPDLQGHYKKMKEMGLLKRQPQVQAYLILLKAVEYLRLL
jgi:hypothetical protein